MARKLSTRKKSIVKKSVKKSTGGKRKSTLKKSVKKSVKKSKGGRKSTLKKSKGGRKSVKKSVKKLKGGNMLERGKNIWLLKLDEANKEWKENIMNEKFDQVQKDQVRYKKMWHKYVRIRKYIADGLKNIVALIDAGKYKDTIDGETEVKKLGKVDKMHLQKFVNRMLVFVRPNGIKRLHSVNLMARKDASENSSMGKSVKPDIKNMLDYIKTDDDAIIVTNDVVGDVVGEENKITDDTLWEDVDEVEQPDNWNFETVNKINDFFNEDFENIIGKDFNDSDSGKDFNDPEVDL